MSNVSDRDNTGTVMTGANTENEIPDIHAEQAAAEGVVRVPVRPRVNGQLYTIVIEPRMTLLDAWREELGLTAPRKHGIAANAVHAPCMSTGGASSPA
jgi:hypothetical protein